MISIVPSKASTLVFCLIIQVAEQMLSLFFILVRVLSTDKLHIELLKVVLVLFRPDPGRQNHQTSEGTDDDSVNKRFEYRHHAFRDRFISPRGSVCNGGASLSGFIGKEAPVYAAIECIGETGAKKSTNSSGTTESIPKNRKERWTNIFQINQDDPECSQEINDCP